VWCPWTSNHRTITNESDAVYHDLGWLLGVKISALAELIMISIISIVVIIICILTIGFLWKDHRKRKEIHYD
jgi:hypothetical protein